MDKQRVDIPLQLLLTMIPIMALHSFLQIGKIKEGIALNAGSLFFIVFVAWLVRDILGGTIVFVIIAHLVIVGVWSYYWNKSIPPLH